MKSETPRMTRARGATALDGLGVSGGIAIGTAHVIETGALQVPEYGIGENGVEEECARFAAAVARALRQVRAVRAKAHRLPEVAAEEIGYLLDAHEQMLSGSRLVRGVDRRIREQRINAEAAVQAEISEIAKGFEAMRDSYLAARAADIRETGNRLVRSLRKSPIQAFSQFPEGTIILAAEITPADTALMDPRRIAGFATSTGGAEGHTAIMARALGLPAVVGVPNLTAPVANGDTVVVDGTTGRVVINPSSGQRAQFERQRDALQRARRGLTRLRRLSAVTRDGTEITLQANIELPQEIAMVRDAGAEGIGLLRSEYMYINRDRLPSEEEQFQSLRAMVTAMDGRPVTVRTLDVGGEKLGALLVGLVGDSPNPALGLRAIRLSLKVRRLLETQLAAILRAGAYGPVRILLPMVSVGGEVAEVRRVLASVVRRLRRRRVKIAAQLPPVGVKIEIPGAALAADALAQDCDFFSIGTNDLTMYTLAIDRGDEQVAYLYNPLHPSVLRLIQFTTEAALRARIPVCLCGEMAGNPRYTALLLGLGIRDLSMAPGQIAPVKQRVRKLDLVAASARARVIMAESDSDRIGVLLDEFNGQA